MVASRRPYRPIRKGMVAIGALAVFNMAGLLACVAGPEAQPSPTTAPTGPNRTILNGSPQATDTPTPSLGVSPSDFDPFHGAPELVFLQRVGDDIEVLGWRHGESNLGTRQTVRGATAGLTDKQAVGAALSPDGSVLLVHAYPANHGEQDLFRAFRLDGTGGREIWHATSIGTGLETSFGSADEIYITQGGIARRDRGWTVVDLSADEPIVHDIDLPPFPAVTPSASPDWSTLTINYVPVGLSADRRWLYAMSLHATVPTHRPAYRISLTTGDPERIDAFPTTGPSRIVSRAIDPVSGRLLLVGPFETADEGFVQVWTAGEKEPDVQAELGIVFSATWVDGSVVTGEHDRLPRPRRFRLLSISATGDLTTLLTEHGRYGSLLGIHSGFAGVYANQTDSEEGDLIVVRLADGATSRVVVSEPDGLIGRGLRP